MQPSGGAAPQAIDALLSPSSFDGKAGVKLMKRGGGSKKLMEGGYGTAFWLRWEHKRWLLIDCYDM